MKKRTSSRLERLALLVNKLGRYDDHGATRLWIHKRVDSHFFATQREYVHGVMKLTKDTTGYMSDYGVEYDQLVKFLVNIERCMQKEIKNLTKHLENVTDFLDGEL